MHINAICKGEITFKVDNGSAKSESRCYNGHSTVKIGACAVVRRSVS